MKVSIASVKAKLSVGTEFTGEFIGVDARFVGPDCKKPGDVLQKTTPNWSRRSLTAPALAKRSI